MRKTVHKIFWIWDYDKEEKWLNEMAAKGLSLVSVGLCKYEFEETTENKYTIRLEFLTKSARNVESENYIRFVEETGAEYLGSFKGRWVFFRKEKAKGSFELNSDKTAILKQLKNLLELLTILIIMLTAIGTINIGVFFVHKQIENLGVGIIDVVLSILMMFGFAKLSKMRKNILKEQKLFE